MLQSTRGLVPNSFRCLGFGYKGFVFKQGGAENLGPGKCQEKHGYSNQFESSG